MSEIVGTLIGAVVMLSVVWTLEIGPLKDWGRRG